MDKNLSERLQLLSRKQNSGYSLVEILVVIIILGIIASVAVSSLKNVDEIAKTEQTKAHLEKLGYAITGNPELISGGIRSDYGYVGDVGSLPATLGNLVVNPGGYSTWHGPYIKDDFSTGSGDSEYDNDAWGKTLVYSGGVTITSNGSGTAITRKLANASDDLLYNKVNLLITDIDNNPPGTDFKDSVKFLIYYPNGLGGITTKIAYPGADGLVQYDSIPIGIHTLKYVYLPVNDTLTRKVPVNTGQEYYAEIQYNDDVWGNTISGGTGGGSGVETLRPSGQGNSDDLSSNGCSNNWQCVDETSNDGNSSYVTLTSSSYGTDLYEAQDHSTGTGDIDSVIVYISCQETSSSGRVLTCIRTHGNNYTGNSENPGSSYADYSTTYTTNPSTLSAWTWSEIDDLEIGVYLRRGRCTQVWVEVYYTY